MIIINKDKTAFVAFEEIEKMFIGDSSIKVDLRSGKGTLLGRYNTHVESKIALEIVINRISDNTKIINMPQDKDIEAKVNSIDKKISRSLTGKKVKGHGSS